MLSIAKYFVTYTSFLGNRPDREIEPPDATESNHVTAISPEATAGTSTAQCCTPQTLPKSPQIPLKSPELKVGTACCHTEKRAKTNSTTGAQGTTHSRRFLPQQCPAGPRERTAPPLHPQRKHRCVCQAELAGKCPQSPRLLSEAPKAGGHRSRAGSAPAPWETPALCCSMFSLPGTSKPSWVWIYAA